MPPLMATAMVARVMVVGAGARERAIAWWVALLL